MLALVLAASLQATPADLGGDWTVSLFFSETAPPSQTSMTLEVSDEGRVSGSFYGSPVEIGRATQRGDFIGFTLQTSDNSGAYWTSGRLEEGVIYGQTLSVGRDFLMIWQAEPASP